MYIIKARDDDGVWQHFNASDEAYFSDILAEIVSLRYTDIEVYARINYNVEYSPGELWD